VFKSIDKNTNMPTNSSILGVLLSGMWLLYFFGANLTAVPWFGSFSFDSSELPIVSIYAMYIPIFVMMMVKEKSLNFVKRFLMPSLAICACVFMVVAAFYSHGKAVLFYLVIFSVIMAIGMLMNTKKK
ncbi:MAG: amino acid permease, partial [Peptococcaceae bacterium BRH_c23]